MGLLMPIGIVNLRLLKVSVNIVSGVSWHRQSFILSVLVVMPIFFQVNWVFKF
jgi:hypothetical protein